MSDLGFWFRGMMRGRGGALLGERSVRIGEENGWDEKGKRRRATLEEWEKGDGHVEMIRMQ